MNSYLCLFIRNAIIASSFYEEEIIILEKQRNTTLSLLPNQPLTIACRLR